MVITKEIFDEFQDLLLLNSRSEYTVRSYVYDIEHINELGGLENPSSFRKVMLKKKKEVGDYRYSGLITSARSFSKFAENRGYISEKFGKAIREIKQVPKKKRVVLTPLIAYNRSEQRNILSLASKKYGRNIKGLFWTALHTGLRKRGLVSLELSDIIQLDDSRYAIEVRKEIDKMSVSRRIPFSDYTSPEFEKFFIFRKSTTTRVPTNKLFLTSSRKPIPVGGGTLSRYYAYLSEQLGFRVTLQNCRYTFARNMWDNTGDLYLTQKLMGHADPGQTVDYLKIRSFELNSMVEEKMKDVSFI